MSENVQTNMADFELDFDEVSKEYYMNVKEFLSEPQKGKIIPLKIYCETIYSTVVNKGTPDEYTFVKFTADVLDVKDGEVILPNVKIATTGMVIAQKLTNIANHPKVKELIKQGKNPVVKVIVVNESGYFDMKKWEEKHESND